MRRLSILFVTATILLAANQGLPVTTAADGLPGVPISQEHHHHLVLENAFVKAYEVEVAPHDSTLMHQHLHDYLYVVFGDADITNAVAGKAEVKLKQPDLSVNLSRGPFAHIATNNGDTPFRNITIELLHPQGELKKSHDSITDEIFAGTPGPTREAMMLETEEMEVVAVAIAPKSSWSPAHDGRDRLVVMIDRIHDTSRPKEKNAPFPAGMLAWVPAGKSWNAANNSGKEERFMVLEFKDGAGKQ